MRTAHALATVLPVVFAAVACAPELPLREGAPPLDGAPPGAADVALVSEPVAPLDALPRVFRLRLRFGTAPALSPPVLRIFEGDLSDAQLLLLAAPELPATLAERVVPALVWTAEDEAWLAPKTALPAGARYTVTYGRERIASVRVRDDDPTPLWMRAWPPSGKSPTGLVGVWCGDVAAAVEATPATLEPSRAAGVFRSGVAPGDGSMHCVHFEPSAIPANEAPPSLPPARLAVDDGNGAVALEPAPLEAAPLEALPVVPRVCESGFVPLGSGCALVQDDRLLLQTPPGEELWSVQAVDAPELDRVFVANGSPLLVWPLPVDRPLELVVTRVDALGGIAARTERIRTRPPMAHLVIDEVLANPVGPEPRQEWVELVNDGLVTASLEGMRLADVGGEATLPKISVPPGGRVLVVNDGYDPSGKWDPAPVPGTLLVRVPHLGKDGLSNDGEPLELTAASGEVVSTFPGFKTKAGRSVYRVNPQSLSEFLTSAPGGSTPGAPKN